MTILKEIAKLHSQMATSEEIAKLPSQLSTFKRDQIKRFHLPLEVVGKVAFSIENFY